MPINIRDFKYHEAVVYDLIACKNNSKGADAYVERVAQVLAKEAQSNPELKEAVDNLGGFADTLKALDTAAKKQALTLDDYLNNLEEMAEG